MFNFVQSTFTNQGSCAFNLLVITSFSIFLTPVDSILHINKILIFLNSFVFSLLCYTWLFLILLVISPGQIDIWEAAALVALYALLATTSTLIDKQNIWQQNDTFPTVYYESKISQTKYNLEYSNLIFKN